MFIAGVILFLIAAALYWFGGAWGVALLWGLGVLFLLPLAPAPIAIFLLGRQKFREREWPAAAANLLGSLAAGLAWLAAFGYCAYQGYQAIP